MKLSTDILDTLKIVIRKSEEQLKEGKNYLIYYDPYFAEKNYTYVSNFFSYEEKCTNNIENFFYQQKNKPEFMPEYLIPIASIGNGDFLCLDRRKDSLPVCYWCHELEADNIYLISENLGDLSSKFLDKKSLGI